MNHALLAQGSFWLPPPSSAGAQIHDYIFYLLLGVMAFFFFLVIAVMLAFVVVYRRRKGQQQSDDAPTHNTPLEIAWTIIPLVIVVGFFVLGLKYYVQIEAVPPDAVVIDVEASQWQFNFKYPNGAESNELYLQVNRPVVLKLTSKDVTHAVYIPEFRVQRNAVPGQTKDLWFKPTELTTGVDAEGNPKYLHVFCTQYCGNGHAEMHSKAFVLEPKEYEQRLADAANIFVDKNTKQPLPYKKVGEKLYGMYCSQCHSNDGRAGTAPTWKGLYKRDHEFAKSNVPGYTLKDTDDDAKWDAYLRESILHPEYKIVQGFENKMPAQETTFSGSPIKEKKLAALIEYIKSLGDSKYYHEMPTPKLEPEAGAKAEPGTSGKTPETTSSDKPATDKPVAEGKEQGK